MTLTDIAAVQRRSRPLRRSGVAHLVVDNQVDAATHSVVGEVGQGQSFRYNPLASEGAVTMDLRKGQLLSENSGFFSSCNITCFFFLNLLEIIPEIENFAHQLFALTVFMNLQICG